MTAKPFPFQSEGVNALDAFLTGGEGALLADSMGLGKTLQALLLLKRHPEWRPAVIVCPASVRGGWEAQASEHLNMRVDVLMGQRPPKTRLLTPQVVVLSYDVLKFWADWLIGIKPMMVIADECQMLTNRGAQRTRAMKRLVEATRANGGKFLAVSGTPLTNKPSELWPVLNMIDPKRWRNFMHFTARYTFRKRTPWGWDFSRPRRLPKLHATLKKTCMVRRLKEDVLHDLPEKSHNVVPIKLTARKEYDEAERDFRRWLVSNFGPKANRSLKAEAVVKVGHLKRLAAKLKLKQMISWVQNFLGGSDEKIILFCVHKKVVAALKESFKGSAVVTGDVTGSKRDAEFRRFNTDPKCRVFIGNIQAAGVGWSASACSNVAFLELAWTPGAMDQAIDRIHGIGRGQKGKVSTAHYLLAAGTIEERIAKLLDKKRKTLVGVLDGKREDLKFDLIDALVGEMLKEAA